MDACSTTPIVVTIPSTELFQLGAALAVIFVLVTILIFIRLLGQIRQSCACQGNTSTYRSRVDILERRNPIHLKSPTDSDSDPELSYEVPSVKAIAAN